MGDIDKLLEEELKDPEFKKAWKESEKEDQAKRREIELRLIKERLKYKGYRAEVEYDSDMHFYCGSISGIRDCVVFRADSVKEIEREFKEAVDDYLIVCMEINKEPDTPDII